MKNELNIAPSNTVQNAVKNAQDKLKQLVALSHVAKLFKEDKKKLSADGLTVTQFLSPRVLLTKENNNVVSETTIRDIKELEKNPPDAIVVMGNNDLQQINHVASLYEALYRAGKAPKKIYISGKGGHGTTPGFIFNHPEADSMKEYLVQLGVPSDVIVKEGEATNSGENAKLVSQLMQQYDQEYHPDQTTFKHILISGTPNGILRQLKTFEKQSSYPWETLSAFPPDEEKLKSGYYQEKYSNTDTMLNLICSLRELSNFMKYAVNSHFMSHRNITNQIELEKSIKIMVEYYNRLTGEKVNALKLYQDFKSACELKEKGEEYPQKNELMQTLNPIFTFFSTTFSLVSEDLWMKRFPHDITLENQTEALNKQEFFVPNLPKEQKVKISPHFNCVTFFGNEKKSRPNLETNHVSSALKK